MNITEEEINPLDISFSNEKGFEPSTPSQTSPPVKERSNQPSLHIRNPIELFAPSPTRSPYPLRNFTPPSRSSQLELMRFSTNRKENRKKESSLTAYRKWVPTTDILLTAAEEKKKKELLNWQSVQSSHIREISRLDILLTRVEKNISLYSKLYLKKRF